jgi:hypothetical protein
MSLPWRIWVVFVALGCIVLTGLGMGAAVPFGLWPVAGLWMAAGFASVGLSVWVAAWLIVVGVAMDLMSEAPVGAWPLALICAYGVALMGWSRTPPMPIWIAEAIAVLGGLVVAALALGVAGGVAGHQGFSRGAFMYDFMLTAVMYLGARLVLVPASIRREGRR